MLTVRSTINFASQTVPPIIPVVQGDPGRAILFTLADFTIPAGATATYYVQKPSGEAVYNNATIDGNNVLVNLTAQSIIEKGDNYGQVRIAVGEDVVTSFDFILLVKEFRGIDAVQSLTEMNIFDKAVEQAADAIDEVKTDALEAIDDAKDEAIEEVTSNFDLKLDTSSTKGVQNQVITQAINTVNNAIGDLSGETVTPTATNNYGVGGNVGQAIETWATTEYWHGIYAVTAGNRYAIQTVSDYPQQIVVWFTNSSNVILEIHKAFATDHVEMVCTAPTGATKLFVMSYGYDAYHGTVQKVEPLSETVSNLKDGLQAKFGFKSQTNASLFDADDVWGGSAIARTRRWFANHVFNSGDVIDDISYAVDQDSSATTTVYTEIWEENNGTLTKVFSDSKNVTVQTVHSGTVVTYHVASDYTVQHKAYVCFCLTGNRNSIPYTVDSTGNDNVLVSTDVDPTTETLALSGLSTFAIKLIPSITISYTAYVGVNVVTIGDGMDYEEIQDALIAINDDTATNPYTLWLMPKSTPYKPFSMLRDSFTDNYPWSGIRTRNISIIGMDKAHCVIRSDSGNYKLPCGEPLTNGIIKNITFVMTNDDQDPNATQGGYCLHIDCKPLNDMGYKMIIEDCDFEDSSGPCVGIGVHANCDLQFRNCHFDTTLSANYNPHEGYRNLVDYGVVYAHTSTAATAPDQHLTVVDCMGECAEGSKSLRIDKTTQYDPETSSFVYTLIRNVFWNKTLNAAGYGISGSLTADAKNFGNNNV